MIDGRNLEGRVRVTGRTSMVPSSPGIKSEEKLNEFTNIVLFDWLSTIEHLIMKYKNQETGGTFNIFLLIYFLSFIRIFFFLIKIFHFFVNS